MISESKPVNRYSHSFLSRWQCFIFICYAFVSMSIFANDNDVYERTQEQSEQIAQLSPKAGWAAIPIPISNPTLGTGLQAVLLYLHPQKAGDSNPPNPTSGIAAMWTDSDSTFVGVFHNTNFINDHYRLKAFAGTTDFKLRYFGIGNSTKERSINYNIKSVIAVGEFLARIPKTKNWFAGGRFNWVDSEFEFPSNLTNIELPTFTIESITSSIGIVVSYDDRNDNYYPTKGQYMTMSLLRDDDKWGSDYNFNQLSLNYNIYWPIDKNQIMAFRASFDDVNGGSPFYMLPNLKLRGIEFGRYVDNTVISLHGEWRYKFPSRWGVIAFVETGRTGVSFDKLSDSESIFSYGVGIRWQVAKEKLLNVGLDIAIFEGEESIYIRIGESF